VTSVRKLVSKTAVRLAAGFAVVSFLVGCAAGSPTVADRPTSTAQPTVPPTATPIPTATATHAATSTFPATSTPKPEASPATPTPEATTRPDPPPDPGTGESLVIDHGDSGRNEIALTFDAGADRGYAEEILDTLAHYHVKASFGITGHWADENPDLVKRMVDEGHMVFNHTYSHRSWTGFSTADFDAGILSTDERTQELTDTEQSIAAAADGYDPKPYFRPPYGDYDEGVLVDLENDGYYLTIMWSCDTFGWNGATVDEIIERCGSNPSAGDIILMHVGAASLDAAALPQLIETLQDQGFDLVTVEELLQPAEN
jgi:peptidoglycan-N-acetylglucosamine deacetylase